MNQVLYQVDAFTKTAFSGNPAAICILDKPADESWMQKLALENNLSETAFLYKKENKYYLRWFTPTVEVDLCGHATLASAHILYEQDFVPANEPISFMTKSGQLTAVKKDNGIELNFPATPPAEIAPPEKLLDALGVKSVYAGKNKFDYLVEVASEDIVRKMKPDFSRLYALNIRGVIVTAKSDTAPYDIISRFFAPGSGINEDPVTGSAHCTLAPFWSEKLGKMKMHAYQASARGGELTIIHENDRVKLIGNAITVMRMELI